MFCSVKHRRRTTAPQLKILEANFELSTKPDVPTRQLLADKLNMTPREVQVWVCPNADNISPFANAMLVSKSPCQSQTDGTEAKHTCR